MAGRLHVDDPGVGLRAVLPAQRRLHDAGVPRTALWACVPLVPDDGLRDRLRRHQDLRVALCRRPRAAGGARLGLPDVGHGDGGHDGDLHDIWRSRGGHLYRTSTGGRVAGRRGDADDHRPRAGGRYGRPAGGVAARLFPHDQALVRSELSVDGDLLRRADSRHLVLVHGPDDRAARARGEERGERPRRRAAVRPAQDPSSVRPGAARADCARAVPGHQRRRGLPDAGHPVAADRTRRIHGRGADGGVDVVARRQRSTRRRRWSPSMSTKRCGRMRRRSSWSASAGS